MRNERKYEAANRNSYVNTPRCRVRAGSCPQSAGEHGANHAAGQEKGIADAVDPGVFFCTKKP